MSLLGADLLPYMLRALIWELNVSKLWGGKITYDNIHLAKDSSLTSYRSVLKEEVGPNSRMQETKCNIK